jgi:isocitrate/isopropylmalate dehydrogenase
MLLEYLGDPASARAIESAIWGAVAQGIRTRDMGGSAGTREFGEAVTRILKKKAGR